MVHTGEEHDTTWKPANEQSTSKSLLEEDRHVRLKYGLRFSGNSPLGCQPLGAMARGGKLVRNISYKMSSASSPPLPPVPRKRLEHCPEKAACVNGANICLAVCFLLSPLISKPCLFSLLIILIPQTDCIKERQTGRQKERKRFG